MRHSALTLVCMLACIVAGTDAYGLAPDASGHPFKEIVDANVFRLRPPPIQSLPPEIPKPLPMFTVTGMGGFGKKFVLLEGWLPAKQFFNLAQGERVGEVEVLRIDEKAGVVEMKIFGTVTNLSFERNGLKYPGSTPSAAPGSVSPSQVTHLPPQPQLNRDENALVIETERERLRQAGDPRANLMPPTHLTPAGAPGTEVSSEGGPATGINPIAPVRPRGR
jgi:hypothetical protein